MKTILLILAIAGFTMGDTYAQNCACNKHKHHKTTMRRRTTNATKTAVVPAANMSEPVYVSSQIEPCTRYRKHNILVTECPNSFYDNSDINRFEADGEYMGNYPTESGTMKATMLLPEAPQHTTIDNYKGVAPASGNACTYNCSSY